MASHCTNLFQDIGGVEGETVHQPHNPWIGSKVVGEETIDPNLQDIDHPFCPHNYLCRYSDAAYAELDSDEDLDLGMIARPEDYGETDVNPAYETFEVVYERSSFSVG